LPGTVGAGRGEAGVQILHFLPTSQAPPGLRRAQRHFVEKGFDGAANRLVDFELVRDRHLRNSAVSVTNMVRCSLLRLAGRRGAYCAKVRQQRISFRAIRMTWKLLSPSAHLQHCPRNIRSRGGQQPNDCLCNLLRPSRSSHRNRRLQSLQTLRLAIGCMQSRLH